MSVSVATLICIQWRIYLQSLYRLLRCVRITKRMMPTADHSTAKLAMSCQIAAGRSGWCKKIKFEGRLFCRHFNFKNSAPECTRTRHFQSENWKKNLGRTPAPPAPTPSAPRPARLRRSTFSPLIQSPRYARGHIYFRGPPVVIRLFLVMAG